MHQDDEETNHYEYKVIDNKNIEGKTLASRRLKMSANGTNLKKLGNACFFVSDLMKLAKSTTWFIDASGRTFNYRKSKYVKLNYHKIIQVLAMPSGGAILVVQGIPTRFKVLYAPTADETYAGILELSHGNYILYGLYDQQYDSSRRMI